MQQDRDSVNIYKVQSRDFRVLFWQGHSAMTRAEALCQLLASSVNLIGQLP
jgi:hypothetical protein